MTDEYNPRGALTLFQRETRRFLRVKMQTIIAPALTAVMYLIVFRYAMGERHVPGLDVPYFEFLIPGLIMMSMLQNAFANTSSSLITSKVMNVHVFLLMAPVAPIEVVLAALAASVVRALVVAGVLLLVLFPFADIHFAHVWMILLYGVCGSIIMGGIGILSGMWAQKFDDMATISNFIILPLTFLSGVFYSVHQLPEFWQQINHFNPFFYLIDGFRYGFIGVGDTNPAQAALVVVMAALAVTAACWWAWKNGWKMKE
jgi:ABC-2 type transport system permease protein